MSATTKPARRTIQRQPRPAGGGGAQTFVRIFLEFIWKPFDEAGRPESEWPHVRAALDQLRPLASEALTAAFQPTMTRAVEVAFGKQIDPGRTRKS